MGKLKDNNDFSIKEWLKYLELKWPNGEYLREKILKS